MLDLARFISSFSRNRSFFILPPMAAAEDMAAAEEKENAPREAPFPSYHSLGSLQIPLTEDLLGATALDDESFTSALQDLRAIAQRKQPADHDVKFWSGDPNPFRNGTDDSPITDEAIIAREEEVRKRAAEQDDAAAVRVPWWWWPYGERSEAEPRKSIYEARKGHKRQFGEQKWEARYRPTVSFPLMHM